MERKTILNRACRLPGILYGRIRLVGAGEECERHHLKLEVRPRANGRELCSDCGQRALGYKRLRPHCFQIVPALGLPTLPCVRHAEHEMPRYDQVKVMRLPWAEGKEGATKDLVWFLASWAQRLSRTETADVFEVRWERVQRAVGTAVAWCRERGLLEGVATIGVHGIAWQSGKYPCPKREEQLGAR